MNFSIHVLCAPNRHQSSLSALRFCQAALDRGHQIQRVFFSGDGVLTGNRLTAAPQGEPDWYAGWRLLARDHGVELVVCISASLRRGVLDAGEAGRYQKDGHNLAPEFILSGLGQLVEAGLECDRLITFGA
ncbi:MAG: sulfurtransferase complex subunit TusD [Pseudomonadota bacterium]|nr:sulfurtransferase complex subunit TusD [Pseudomonadales bacterium]MDY6921817.1 sulfurtransferase complex subunit TusD [Pseudomonadota bacterium]